MQTFIHVGQDQVPVEILGTTHSGSLHVSLKGEPMYLSKQMLDMILAHPEIELRTEKRVLRSGMETTWLV